MYLLRRPEDLPPSLGSRLTIRVALFSGLVIAALAMIFLRLWYLEVLSGERYRALAEDNRIREIRVQPPRGQILDRRGKVLVDNRTVLRLELRPDRLPKSRSKRRKQLAALARLTGISPARMRAKLRDAPRYAGYPIVLGQGLGRRALFYLLEHGDRFPGASVERTYVRRYARGSLAAHVLGIAAEVSPAQLGKPRYRGLMPGDIVGQAGVEYAYDRYLRGTPGSRRIQVDAMGRPRGTLASRPATAGANLRLTLDGRLQATAEEALRSSGLPGAFVAMDIHTGAVLAIGSHPGYDPAFYTKPHTTAEYRALESRADAPLLNRADQGGYPTGSTFKPITATAALEEGLIEPQEIVLDTGQITVGGQVFRNAGGAVNGAIDMSDALKVSSDVYFYRLGLEADASGARGQIQGWARALGLGEETGIDLPGEGSGLIPTPAWRNRQLKRGGNPYIDRPWTAGDNVNLAIGQGDLQVTPLQLAGAYAALANGGTVVTPHLALEIAGAGGESIKEVRPRPRRRLQISRQTRNTILDGLRRAAMEAGGTSFSVFGDFPFAIAGKTGTVERGEGVPDQSWYAAVAPYGEPEIVVVATIERGGFGVEAAAPVVARILESYFGLNRAAAGRAPAATPSLSGAE